MKKIFGLLTAIMIFSIPVFADIRLPDAPKPKPTATPKPAGEKMGKMYISVRSNAKIATLKIRREMFNELRAAIDEAEGIQNPTAAGAFFNITPTQTIASGMFLSLAFVFGGIWIFRAKDKSPKVAVS